MDEETELLRLINLAKFTNLIGAKQLAESLVKTRSTVRDCALAIPRADAIKPLIQCGYIPILTKLESPIYHINAEENYKIHIFVLVIIFLRLTQTQ